MPSVSLVRGDDSYYAVAGALSLIKGDVRVPDRPVLVKPNMVSGRIDLAATPVPAVRATLDFLREQGVREFIVGEGTAAGDTMAAFDHFGFKKLADDYDIEFVDLNKDETIEVDAYDSNCQPMKLHVARTVRDSWRVSVARMKTHDSVIVTLAIKNMAVGSIVQRERSRLSHGARSMNLTLARMNRERGPDLSVIDGIIGMEGSGPVSGTAKKAGVALASADSVAIDVVGAQVMGYDPHEIGYLHYLMELQGLEPDNIDVLGEHVTDCVTKFKDHPRIDNQRQWHMDNWQDVFEAVPV